MPYSVGNGNIHWHPSYYPSTHPVIRHIRKNAMNDEKIGFVFDKVNISITVYQVRMAHVKRLKL
jgi:hypothetical protein